jgi:hypothetical protein
VNGVATKGPIGSWSVRFKSWSSPLVGGSEEATHLDKAVLSLRLAEAADWLARVELMAAREHQGRLLGGRRASPRHQPPSRPRALPRRARGNALAVIPQEDFATAHVSAT